MTPTTLTKSPPTDAPHSTEPPASNESVGGDLSELSDEALVDRFCEGHRGALTILYKRYNPSLIAYGRSKGLGPARAEDVASHTWGQVLRHAFRFDAGKSQFATWLRTIHGNLIKNIYRNRDSNPMTSMSDVRAGMDDDDRDLAEGVLLRDESTRPDDLAAERDVRRQVEAVVEQLPVHLRLTFLLRYRCGMKYRRMSDATGVKLGTTKSRLNRARKAFAEIVARDAPDVLDDLGLRPEVHSDYWSGN